MGKTLYEKVYDAHVVMQKPGELPLLYIDRHIIHEVTSPQAFAGLRAAGRKLRRPDLMLATMDHDISTRKPTLDACMPLAYRGTAKRFHAARHNLGLRRFAYGHSRRLRCFGLRHWYVRSRTRHGDADAQAAALKDHADPL